MSRRCTGRPRGPTYRKTISDELTGEVTTTRVCSLRFQKIDDRGMKLVLLRAHLEHVP